MVELNQKSLQTVEHFVALFCDEEIRTINYYH